MLEVNQPRKISLYDRDYVKELAESHDFIGYSADTSVEIDLRTMLLNMHDYNHQTGAHHEPMKVREVQLEQFGDSTC